MTDVPSCSLDWPLSREEKKNRVLRLYDDDLQAADQLLKTGEAAIAELRVELVKARCPGSSSDACMDDSIKVDSEDGCPDSRTSIEDEVSNEKREAAERLRLAIVSMQEVLDSLRGTPLSAETNTKCDDDRRRTRSEGAKTPSRALSPALKSIPRRRRSRGGEPLRVSFGEVSPPASFCKSCREPEGCADVHDEWEEERAVETEEEEEPEPAPDPAVPEASGLSAFPHIWRRVLGTSLAFGKGVSQDCIPLRGRQPHVMSIESFLNEDVPDFPFAATAREHGYRELQSRDDAPRRGRNSRA